MIFSPPVSAALCVLLGSLAAVHYLLRAMHIYQLESYQNPSFCRRVRENRLFDAKKLALCGFIALCAAMLAWPAIALVCVPANLQKRPPAKKPFVLTPRVKRMLATYAVLALAASAAMLAPLGQIPLRCLCAALSPAFALFAHKGVMLVNHINSPFERALSRRFIGQARDILRSMPGLQIIGITGSYGKTSTKFFLKELLSSRFNVYMTPGNFNTTLGVVRAVREGLRPVHDIFLCEMGARHKGDIAEICELVRPQMGVLTYIGQQHLETFGSRQAIIDTKLELARAVPKIFVNIDSETAAAQQYYGQCVRYGSGEDADYMASGLQIDSRGLSFTVTAPDGGSARFVTKLLGRANAQNLTGAIAVAHSLGVPFDALAACVRALKSAPHRLELKRLGDLTVIDDTYNSNPDGAQVALETLGMCAGYRIAVTPGLVELGEVQQESNIELGRAAALYCDCLITVGKNPGAAVAEGARGAGLDEVYEAPDIETAMARVRGIKADGKVVLLLNDLPDNY